MSEYLLQTTDILCFGQKFAANVTIDIVSHLYVRTYLAMMGNQQGHPIFTGCMIPIQNALFSREVRINREISGFLRQNKHYCPQ